MAASVLRVLRDVLPRARGRGRRDDGPGVPEHDHPDGGRRRARIDGDGDHHVHGQGVGRAPEPGRQRRLLAARRLPLAARAGLHRRSAGRCDCLRRCFFTRRDQGLGQVRSELSRPRLFGLAGAPDGGGAHARARERDPRHGLGRAEHRHLRGDRRRRLHRARGSLGQPDLGCVDEPGPHVRARPRRATLTDYWVYVVGPLAGCCDRGRLRLRAARFGRRAGPAPARPRETWTPRSRGPSRPRESEGMVGERPRSRPHPRAI